MRYHIENYTQGTDSLAKSMEEFCEDNPGFRVVNMTINIGPYGAERHRWTVLYGMEVS